MPSESLSERIEKNIAIKSLYDEYCSACKSIAVSIVKDFYNKNHKYFALSAKGIAGGQKFLLNGIFIKLVADIHGIYGGNAGASKAANLELRSVETLLKCNLKNVYYPLICIVDYFGFRLVCVSHISAISNETLVFGSENAGKELAISNPFLNAQLFRFSRKYHLGFHNIKTRNGDFVSIPCPVDLEGHAITEGSHTKFYLIDYARLFPPENPDYTPHTGKIRGILFLQDASLEFCTLGSSVNEFMCDKKYWDSSSSLTPSVCICSEGRLFFNSTSTEELNKSATSLASLEIKGNAFLVTNHGTIFYQHFRPEYLSKLPDEISSDALSLFGSCTQCFSVPSNCPHGGKFENYKVQNATEKLFSFTIPEFAKNLNERVITPSDGISLVKQFQRFGCSARWIGFLRTHVELSYLREFILLEMIIRTTRSLFTALFREALRHDICWKESVKELCNLIFGCSKASKSFWAELKERMLFKYSDVALTSEEKLPSFLLQKKISLPALLIRISESTGLIFNDAKINAVFDNPLIFEVDNPFDVDDFLDILPRLKQIDLESPIIELVSTISAKESSNSDNDYHSIHFHRVSSIFGDENTLTIASAFKLAGLYSRNTETLQSSLEMTNKALENCKYFSHHYITGLITKGLIYFRLGNYKLALTLFMESLSLATNLFGTTHPLVARIYCHISRTNFALESLESKALGVSYLDKAYSLYAVLYGKEVINYIVPLIMMNKSQEIASSIGLIAYPVKDLILSDSTPSVELDKSHEVLSRLSEAIRILEEIEGVTPGYFFGKAFSSTECTIEAIEEEKQIGESSCVSCGDFQVQMMNDLFRTGVLCEIAIIARELSTFDSYSFFILCPDPKFENEGETSAFIKLFPMVCHNTNYYSIFFVPFFSGSHQLVFHKDNQEPLVFPFEVCPGFVCPDFSKVSGSGIVSTTMGEEAPVNVQLFDYYSNPITKIMDDIFIECALQRNVLNAAALKFLLEFNNNGEYSGTYSIEVSDNYHLRISIIYGNSFYRRLESHVPGSPFTITASGLEPCTNRTFNAAIARVCHKCNLKRPRTCIRCRGPLQMMINKNHDDSGRVCSIHALQYSRKCILCKSMLFGQDFEAKLCHGCSIRKYCIAVG